MRFLAIDLGSRRTGLAVGDDETGLASPAGILTMPRGRPERLIGAICAALESHRPDALVIGLPLNMDGTESPGARKARSIADELRQRSDLPVHFQDERLTTFAADQHMANTGRTRRQKKELRDALAATQILLDFFEARRVRADRPADDQV